LSLGGTVNYDKIDRRVQRMEHAVTAREYDWDQRLNRNS
jgi:hypothetical protein